VWLCVCVGGRGRGCARCGVAVRALVASLRYARSHPPSSPTHHGALGDEPTNWCSPTTRISYMYVPPQHHNTHIHTEHVCGAGVCCTCMQQMGSFHNCASDNLFFCHAVVACSRVSCVLLLGCRPSFWMITAMLLTKTPICASMLVNLVKVSCKAIRVVCNSSSSTATRLSSSLATAATVAFRQ